MEGCMGEPSKLGRRVKFLREQRDLSISELARLANVSRPGLSLLERGKQVSMNADGLARLARVLGVTADSLLYGDILEEGADEPPAATRAEAWGVLQRG
jgi:transcriptional regulator with XRE-family HTH domain